MTATPIQLVGDAGVALSPIKIRMLNATSLRGSSIAFAMNL